MTSSLAGAPTVSVVITTYNHAHYLREAIASVLAQTRPADEIIVVDDGSSDHPECVAREFAEIQLITQPNQGLSAARNTGLAAARGTYILFLDADDRLTEIALATGVACLEKHPSWTLSYGAFRLFWPDPAHQVICAARPVGRDPYRTLLSENCIGMHGTVLYRRAVLADIGGFDTTLRACEDYDVYLRLAQDRDMGSSPEVLAEYRQHDDNMSSDLVRMHRAARLALHRQRDFAATNTSWEAARQRGLRSWFHYYGSRQLDQLSDAFRSRRQPGNALTKTMHFMLPHPAPALGLIGDRVWRRAKKMGFGGRLHRRFRGPGGVRAIGTTRISTQFGFDRGKPIDRGYIEDFLERHKLLIAGNVLEIGDTSYTTRFGEDRVSSAEAFHRFAGHPGVSYVGDLAGEHNLPADRFDCMVLTQTLHLIFDMPQAIASIWKALKPGGVALITVPWISPIDQGEWGSSWYWSISPAALRKLLETHFDPDDVTIYNYGNALAASAFLYGLAEHEVRPQDLEVDDPWCPVIVTACARKSL
jgi:SAM-dependent methyltransferase